MEAGLQKQADLHTIEGVTEYAANDMKTEQRSYVTVLNVRSEEETAKQFAETKDFWTRVSGKTKNGGRVCFHGYQSFVGGEVTAEQAHRIGVELAERLWGDQFEVLIATHCTTATGKTQGNRIRIRIHGVYCLFQMNVQKVHLKVFFA